MAEFSDIGEAPILTQSNLPALPNPYEGPEWDGNQDFIDEGFEKQLVASLMAKVTPTGRATPPTLKWLHGQHDDKGTEWYRRCLSLARQARALPGVYPDAQSAWDSAHRKHPLNEASFRNVPRGAPLFFRGGEWGHVATYAGRTKDQIHVCWSNDAYVRGGVSLVPVDFFSKNWGFELLGWTEDLNGYDLKLPSVERGQGKPLPDQDKNDKPAVLNKDRLVRLKDWRDNLAKAHHRAIGQHHMRVARSLEFRLKIVQNFS